MMPLQRVCDAENQARNKLSNGPLRAQSNVDKTLHRVFCDVLVYVSYQGYVRILLSAWGITLMNQGGTTDKMSYSPLTERKVCQGRFYLLKLLWRALKIT